MRGLAEQDDLGAGEFLEIRSELFPAFRRGKMLSCAFEQPGDFPGSARHARLGQQVVGHVAASKPIRCGPFFAMTLASPNHSS